MNKFLDILLVVVVIVFGILLVMTLMKTCGKSKVPVKDPGLESSVKMGEDNNKGEKENDAIAWDENITAGDSAALEADGIRPEEIGEIDPELASRLSEQGDEGLKKDKKSKIDNELPADEEGSKVNVGPGGDVYFVIAGSFSEPQNAINMAKKLEEYGYPAEVAQFLNNNLKSVIVQRFDKKDEASALVTELKRKYKIDSYAVKRRQ